MGDFNFPQISWTNGCVTSIGNENSTDNTFSETIRDTFLYQHVNVPTFQVSNEVATNILDLIFTTNRERCEQWNQNLCLVKLAEET